MVFNPPKWGGENTSADYQIFMKGTSAKADPISLEGHGMASFNQELSDPVDIRLERIERGRKVFYTKRLRSADLLAITFNLLMPAGGPLWTPALQRARASRSGCESTFYAKRLCVDNADLEHAYIWPDCAMNPPTRVQDFIPISDNAVTPAEWQSEVRAPQEQILWNVGVYEVHDGSVPFYAIAFRTDECAGCDDDAPYSRLVAVGGVDGANDLIVAVSDDRFATNDVVTTPAPQDHVGTSVWTDGNLCLVGFASHPDVANVASTTGGTLFSANINDDTPVFTLDADITEPVRGVAKFGQFYLAVGGTASGAAMLWYSVDGINWTSQSSAALPGTHALTGIAVDNDEGFIYMVGENGTCLKGRVSAGAISIEALAPTGVSTTQLNAVAVLGPDHIAVGGESGYYAESEDGGVTWTQPSVPTAGDILSIAGSDERTLVGTSAAEIFHADFLTDFGFEDYTLETGATLTNGVQGLASTPEDFNYFAAVTAAAGEVAYGRPFYPNS